MVACDLKYKAGEEELGKVQVCETGVLDEMEAVVEAAAAAAVETERAARIVVLGLDEMVRDAEEGPEGEAVESAVMGFLFRVRALVQSPKTHPMVSVLVPLSFAVFSSRSQTRILHLADICARLTTFAAQSKLSTMFDPPVHGFFDVLTVPSVRTSVLSSLVGKRLGFKIHRTWIDVDDVHLPPPE